MTIQMFFILNKTINKTVNYVGYTCVGYCEDDDQMPILLTDLLTAYKYLVICEIVEETMNEFVVVSTTDNCTIDNPIIDVIQKIKNNIKLLKKFWNELSIDRYAFPMQAIVDMFFRNIDGIIWDGVMVGNNKNFDFDFNKIDVMQFNSSSYLSFLPAIIFFKIKPNCLDYFAMLKLVYSSENFKIGLLDHDKL